MNKQNLFSPPQHEEEDLYESAEINKGFLLNMMLLKTLVLGANKV
jgi:hypothetical protein